ncbi:unnamed protein product [Knipowitschia caucasica]
MWILSPLPPGGETLYLQTSKNYVVGRKTCDVILSEDQSISRAHALLSTTEQTLTVKDTSKYGTSVNGKRLVENTPVNVTSGSNITFGVFNSKFRVEHMQPVVCSSCLDTDGKASLSEALQFVGGKLVGTWKQECTHLIMSTVKVTIKTICALLSGCPIVKPEFFSALRAAVQNKSPPPEADRFIPEINEPSLNKDKIKIGVISERRELFAGKTFVFLNAKQLTRLSAAVSCGGGHCLLLDEGSLPRDVLESPQSCVVDVTSTASQPLLPQTTEHWLNAVKSIVDKKGLRVITESEIGIAAIYASCDSYCNASRSTDRDSVPHVKSRIPSASLSQSVAVDETMLAAPSPNITAYAANTEPSQGCDRREVSGISAVRETPEKNFKSKTPETKQKRDSQYFVAESRSFSLSTEEQTESKQTIEESKLTEDGPVGRPPQPVFKQPERAKALSQKLFSQKTRTFEQGSPQKRSPQKQSALTSFFQPVNKKRQLEEDISTETSQQKRPVREASVSSQPPETFKDICLEKSPIDSSQSTRENKAQGQKRKEMEDLEELESIMSEDMDCFDEPPPRSQSRVKEGTSKPQREDRKVEVSSKKQRFEEKKDEGRQKNQADLEKPSTSSRNVQTVRIKEQNVSVNIDAYSNQTSVMRPASDPPAVKKQNKLPFNNGGSDFIDDNELLKAEATEVPVKPVTVKKELKEPKLDDSLPKNLLVVEFRDLKVAEPPITVAKPKQTNGYSKNFKCFRKVQMRCVAPVISGTDLLVHNRGINSDLDEWLKDAAEEEIQSRRDETMGDDLFRYNPSKLTRRR